MDVRIIHEGPPIEYISMINYQEMPLITIRNIFMRYY